MGTLIEVDVTGAIRVQVDGDESPYFAEDAAPKGVIKERPAHDVVGFLGGFSVGHSHPRESPCDSGCAVWRAYEGSR